MMTISYQTNDFTVLEKLEEILNDSGAWISDESEFKGETILQVSFKEEIHKNLLLEKIKENPLKYKIKINT